MATLGEALIRLLEAHGVDTVFGIPGVHTVELYRGLARSRIRHVTPRHEQGAGFMADGYARVSGRPGVVFAITGPGVTNAITPMAQARADSIPMLVVSGVNATESLGRGLGYLHELPDQHGLMGKVALFSRRVTEPDALADALGEAFALFASGRPGPVHIEIPLDAMTKVADGVEARTVTARPPAPDPEGIARAAALVGTALRPLVIAGGGARRSGEALRAFCEKLDAPAVLTINARGLMHSHKLAVPASPSLPAVRDLMAESDVVIAVGTELGPTDFDLNGDGGFVLPRRLVRIDIDAEQLARRPAEIAIPADSGEALAALGARLDGGAARGGAARAERARRTAFDDLGPDMRALAGFLETIRDTLPGAIMVGDSTQPVYAGNLYYDHDRPGRWFNSSCGYGALGYAPPAAIGAALADPDATVLCLTGDGGLQFTLGELAVAVETGARVLFLVWNNRGYREIELSMRAAGVEPVGVSPSPPDLMKLAAAYGIPALRVDDTSRLPETLAAARAADGPFLVEIVAP